MFKVNKNSKLNGCRLGLPKNYANLQCSYIVISTAKSRSQISDEVSLALISPADGISYVWSWFFCNWRLNILSWISILQVQHIGYMHSWKQEYAKASLNPSFPSFWTGHWRVWGRVYIFKTSFFKLIADNLVETSYLKVHLELIVQTGFSKEKCLPWLKIHPLDVLIDRSQKVTQTASRNNMCKQRLLALPITSPKPGSQAVSYTDTNSPFPFLVWICPLPHT